MKSKEFHDLSELALNSNGQSWGNLGYWVSGETDYSDACQALATKLGEAVGLDEKSIVFDAGFGCGDQLCLWLGHFQVSDICGINISESQTRCAKLLLNKKGHKNKIGSINTGNINNVDKWPTVIGDRKVSHFLALDCVYHFPSRDRFLKQVSSHLGSGGKVALTDFQLPDQKQDNLAYKLLLTVMLKLSRIPRSNITSKTSYLAELETNGFCNVEVHNISDRVMHGFSEWVRYHKPKGLPLLLRLKYSVTAAFLGWAHRRSILQYSIIIAEK